MLDKKLLEWIINIILGLNTDDLGPSQPEKKPPALGFWARGMAELRRFFGGKKDSDPMT
ncbi:MAG: hypothetical protein NZL83_02415 [Candidatus Absconditabacterales bacterium]|nr:hypothetical protein [Candidatus Absconditabacterales bacterium]